MFEIVRKKRDSKKETIRKWETTSGGKQKLKMRDNLASARSFIRSTGKMDLHKEYEQQLKVIHHDIEALMNVIEQSVDK